MVASPSIRQHLQRKLPDYMVPSAIVLLDEFPLNANGKVDRNALPAPEDVAPAASAVARIAPRDETERRLAALWTKVLGVPEVGVNDNFFELGGHSLLATRVGSRINQA